MIPSAAQRWQKRLRWHSYAQHRLLRRMSLYKAFIILRQRLRVRCGPGKQVGPGNLQGTPFSCYLSARWHEQLWSHQCSNTWANRAVLSSRVAWTLYL